MELFFCISCNQFPVYSITNMHTENHQKCLKFSFLCTEQAHMATARRIPCTTYVEISTRASSHRTPWGRKCWEQTILCKSLLEDKLQFIVGEAKSLIFKISLHEMWLKAHTLVPGELVYDTWLQFIFLKNKSKI